MRSGCAALCEIGSVAEPTLDIEPHWKGAGNFFPAIAEPERTARSIVSGHEDNRSFHARATQIRDTFLEQPIADSSPAMRGRDG